MTTYYQKGLPITYARALELIRQAGCNDACVILKVAEIGEDTKFDTILYRDILDRLSITFKSNQVA